MFGKRLTKSNRRSLKFGFFLLFIAALLGVVDQVLPDRHLLWKPLNIDDAVGHATGTKITMIALRKSDVCAGKLASSKHLTHMVAEPKKDGPECGWQRANVMLETTNIVFSPADVTLQCPMTISSHIWLRDINPIAEKLLGAKIRKIYHYGTYSCRRMRGNSSGNWSEHAYANAWDISAFELENGMVISVLEHWPKVRSPEGRFLRRARDRACKVFRVTLSPDYNEAHHDHFHLDNGPSLSCS